MHIEKNMFKMALLQFMWDIYYKFFHRNGSDSLVGRTFSEFNNYFTYPRNNNSAYKKLWHSSFIEILLTRFELREKDRTARCSNYGEEKNHKHKLIPMA